MTPNTLTTGRNNMKYYTIYIVVTKEENLYVKLFGTRKKALEGIERDGRDNLKIIEVENRRTT